MWKVVRTAGGSFLCQVGDETALETACDEQKGVVIKDVYEVLNVIGMSQQGPMKTAIVGGVDFAEMCKIEEMVVVPVAYYTPDQKVVEKLLEGLEESRRASQEREEMRRKAEEAQESRIIVPKLAIKPRPS
jgi:hypothetical protein